MGKKRPKKCPKITNFDQNQPFWAIKSKIGPKSKFRFPQFLKNDPKLVSSQFLAYQPHFCKSLSDFQFLVKFSQNHHFWRKTLQKRTKNIFFRFFDFFLKICPKKATLDHIWAPENFSTRNYSQLTILPYPPKLCTF